MILNIFQNNPYVHCFRRLGQIANIDEYRIELNTSISVDRRRFNAPAMEQVEAIWQEGSDEQRRFTRSIMVYANSGRAHYIRAYHGCYDSLAYPLFYPCGETGWEDKKLLLEEHPVRRFPRMKRKYTKRVKTGMKKQYILTYAVYQSFNLDYQTCRYYWCWKTWKPQFIYQDLNTQFSASDNAFDDYVQGMTSTYYGIAFIITLSPHSTCILILKEKNRQWLSW